MQLSCDRKLPCQRCIRSARPECCSFVYGTAQSSALQNHSAQEQVQSSDREIRDLRAEVAQLKELLSQTHLRHARDSLAETLCVPDGNKHGQTILLKKSIEVDQIQPDAVKTELSDPKDRSPRGYYHQHTTFQLFGEVMSLSCT